MTSDVLKTNTLKAEPSLPREGEEAIGWMMRLDSRDVTDWDRAAHAAWLAKSPANRAMWGRLENTMSPFGLAARFQGRSGALAEHGLRKRVNRRQILAGIVGLNGIGLGGMAALDRIVPLRDLMADNLTRTGETRSVNFDDSVVTMGPRTGLDLDQSSRRIYLRSGVVMVNKSRSVSGPLTLASGPLELVADAGVFVGRKTNALIFMTAIDHPASVNGPNGTVTSLPPGQSLIYDGTNLLQRPAKIRTETAWTDGLVVVSDESLGDVINRIQPYFSGVIRIDPAVVNRLVSGVFPMKDVDGAIDTIASALDISVVRTTRYWVSLEPSAKTTQQS